VSKPSERSIKRSIKALRVIVDKSHNDPILERIAYAVETALRWATIETVGWDRPEVDVVEEARICKRELHP
jgi:hypothetical protein